MPQVHDGVGVLFLTLADDMCHLGTGSVVCDDDFKIPKGLTLTGCKEEAESIGSVVDRDDQ